MQSNLCVKQKMGTVSERLRSARTKAGFTSAADAARRLGIPYGTYSGHENGSRGVKRDEAERYARAFGVSSGWLLFGEQKGLWDGLLIYMIGKVGRLPEAQFEKASDSEFESALITPMINFVETNGGTSIKDTGIGWVPVVGRHARGIAEVDSLIICQKQPSPVSASNVNQLCFCILQSGLTYLRFIKEGRSEGSYDLEAPLFETMRDETKFDIMPVEAILPPSTYARMLAQISEFGKMAREAAERMRNAE